MGNDQVPTKAVSIRWIMSDPAFECGVRDARANRGFPNDFDTWETNSAWNYERGACLGSAGAGLDRLETQWPDKR
jgi:hypothetical protein